MILSKKSLKYLVLVVLAEFGDAGIDFLMNHVSKGKRVYLGRKPYRSTYFRRTLKDLTTTGYIERINKKGITHLQLTSTGNTHVKRDIPLPYLQKQPWDGYFRSLAYDFPEKQRYARNTLREEMKSWGMGKLQKSILITPYPLEEVFQDFIKTNKLSNNVLVLKTTKLSLEEGRNIAEHVWKLEKVSEEYEKFIDKWLTKGKEGELKPSDQQKIQINFFSLLDSDPHLPYDLLPKNWPANKAKELFLAIQKILTKANK